MITGSMLYDLISWPHRVTMDLYADPASRNEVSPFISMLWEKGASHEQSIIGQIAVPVLDLSGCHGEQKERLTTEAMLRREPLIYRGRITADDLVGEPDLLRFAGHGYVAEVHYGVQVALYTDILERKGISAGRTPFIIDQR